MLQIRVSTTQTKQGSKSTEQTTSVMTIISTQTNAQQTVQWEHTVQLGLQADCDFCDEPIEHSWLPLVSILKGSVGLPTAWSMDSFKGSSLIWNNSCAETCHFGLCCVVQDTLCLFYNSAVGSVQFCEIYPEGRLGVSVSILSGISGLLFDFHFLTPLTFFCLVLWLSFWSFFC